VVEVDTLKNDASFGPIPLKKHIPPKTMPTKWVIILLKGLLSKYTITTRFLNNF